jgi:hypothetical protein
MKPRLALPLLAGLAIVAALVLALALPAFGQTGIQVNNADATRTTSTSLTSGLNSTLSGASLRIVTKYANALRSLGLGAPPGALQTLLGQVMPRVVYEHAASSRTALLPAPPGGLQSTLAQAVLRIVFQYAASARQMAMVYPRALVGDTTAPVISARSAVPAAGGIKVTWTTDEFADSTVVYGTQPGVYPQTRSDPLYVKSHVILLTGLTPGTYYYRVQSRDRSGNLAQSAEGSFTVTAVIPRAYLPLMLRR